MIQKNHLSLWVIITVLVVILLSEILIWMRGGSGTPVYSESIELHSIEPSYYSGYHISNENYVPETDDPQIG